MWYRRVALLLLFALGSVVKEIMVFVHTLGDYYCMLFSNRNAERPVSFAIERCVHYKYNADFLFLFFSFLFLFLYLSATYFLLFCFLFFARTRALTPREENASAQRRR